MASTVEISEIKVDGKIAMGIKVEMPDAPPLILARGSKGVVFCGYLNAEAAEKLNLAAAIARGVATIDELLGRQISYCTKKGEALGIKIGMSGMEALRLLV